MPGMRDKADMILLKALNDPDFRKRLAEDPVRVMEGEGVSEIMAEDLAREIKVDGEPVLSACTRSCSWTCSWTMLA